MKLLSDRGSGTPLVLVCALMCDEELFAGQADRLSRRRRRVMIFQSEGEESLRDAAVELLSMVGALGLRSVDLGGLSMGGAIALEAVSRCPSAVRRLLLMGTRHTADDEDGRAARRETIRQLEEGRMEQVLEGFLPSLLSEQSRRDHGERVRTMFRRLGPALYARQLRTLLTRRDQSGTLAAFQGPLLCLTGAQDSLTPLDLQRRMAALAPRGQWGVIPGNVGHLSSLEAPQAVLREIEVFLTD